jgi:hypothetical protein
VFNTSISITTSMNLRFASTAVDQTPVYCSFTVWLNKLLPPLRHRIVPLFTASRPYVREGDTQLSQYRATGFSDILHN